MGSHDLRTAAYAAQLVMQGWAPLLVCSGASGRLTEGIWKKSEARRFAEEAQANGLDKKKILLEDQSTNTAENLLFSAALLKKNNIPFSRVLLIHKPYMERRVWATACHLWPETAAIVTSPPIPFLEYANQDIQVDELIAIMVGDFQRVIEYPKRGFAAPQEISTEAMRAFEHLTLNGFTSHLI